MKIKDILKKQGEIYKNLPSNEIIEEYNEKIEKPLKTAPSEPHIRSENIGYGDPIANIMMKARKEYLRKNKKIKK